MAYQSLYRKYRPQTFADVMGQGHVVRTLQNAIAAGRVAHGYLFTGTRGTAKTTIARLLAKALNCESGNGPVMEPCNQCAACKAITAGASIDVIEMDAASHRGVADIEEVRKSVGYGPMELRYKVFIIDEAHQLSSDAKDAFLKTLEEPPANVVFILATTEPQSIPITIRSRCQQFDFKRGSLAEIATRLKFVLDAEGVTYTPDAVNLVARGAEGSYRDSLSLLEQVLAFAPTRITADEVNTVLGSLNAEMLSRVVASVASRNAPEALGLAGELLDAGKEARTLLRTLAAHFRDLMLVHIGGPAAAVELSPDEVRRLQHEASLFTPQQMMKAIDILNEAQGETRWNNQHRLLVELTFLKLMTIGDAPTAPLPTAPIVFSNASPAIAAAVAAPPPVSVAPTLTPAPVAPTVTTPPPVVPEPAPVAEAKPSKVEKTAAEPVMPAPTPKAVEPEPAAREPEDEIPSGFFADDATDDEDDYVPPSDEDVPPAPDEDEEPDLFAAPPPASAEAAPPVQRYGAEGLTGGEGDEDGVDENAEPPYEGPGLFDEDDSDERGPDSGNGGPGDEPLTPRTPVASGPNGVTPPVSAPPAGPVAVSPGATATVVAAPPVPEPAKRPAPPPVEEEQPSLFDLDAVYKAWGRFLQEARRISKRTEMMMVTARPIDVQNNIVVIAFNSRMGLDIMSQPKQQEFVRKLLSKCLGIERAGVRFTLADNVPPPPQRVEKKIKSERDPLKELEALDINLPSTSGGTGSSYEEYLPPVPAPRGIPVPPNAQPVFAVSSARPPAERERAEYPSYTPPPSGDPPWMRSAPGRGTLPDAEDPAIAAIREKALANPLVQDVLQVFGGEIVVDE
jgi:DNA polymerase-3 subunit gamma/tau